MISFTPAAEQQMIIDTVRRFAAERLRTAAHDADETRTTPADIVTRGWDLGLLQSTIPEAYGGFGESHSALTGVLAAEELGAGDLPLALYLLTPNLFALPLLHYGTEAQKSAWLPQIIAGAFRPFTAALTEPKWNFDPHALATSATRDGDVYVLSGTKAYVPLAAEAPALLVYANDGGTTQAFIVPRETPGVHIGAREQHMGIRALPTYTLTLDNVRVPADARLGGDAGCDIDHLLNLSRVTLAALAVGVARGALDYAIEYAKSREAFGKPVAQNQSIAFMLAEMVIEVEAMRLMTIEAAYYLDKGEKQTHLAALAKQYADEATLFVTDRAVQALGGHGYIREHPVERWLREGRGFTTFLGMAIL